MRYNLWREGTVKVGEIITDKPLVKGDIVRTVWRVVDAAWQADARDPTNSVSSGDVLVEPVTASDTMNVEKKMMTLDQVLEALKNLQEKKNGCAGDIFVGYTNNGVPTQSSHYEEAMSGRKLDDIVEAVETAVRKNAADKKSEA